MVVLRPGDFATGFTGNRKKAIDEAVFQVYPNYKTAIEKVEHDEKNGLNPIVLAQKNFKIIKKKQPRNTYVIASFEQKLSVLLKHILPAKWFARILEKYYCLSRFVS